MVTIAYFTSRQESKIEWFLASLRRELAVTPLAHHLVVVDFWAAQRPAEFRVLCAENKIQHVAPKPTAWQGPHRRTQQDWFAASNARNTAISLARGEWIAFVDDLSVLTPGWLQEVRNAALGDAMTVTCGAYRKVSNLRVNGDATEILFDDLPSGHDNRWSLTGDLDVFPCTGGWLYGCSLVAPVEGFLRINGFPEAWCDGMGFEDCIAGIMLEKHGYRFVYNRRMLTLESDELHRQPPVFLRSDYGVSPNDKSHVILHAAQSGNGWHANFFGADGLRGLRRHMLAGGEFPTEVHPSVEWFTNVPLEVLKPMGVP